MFNKHCLYQLDNDFNWRMDIKYYYWILNIGLNIGY